MTIVRLFVFTAFLCLVINACIPVEKKTYSNAKQEDIIPAYANGFRITKQNNLRKLLIYNPWGKREILNNFVLWPDSIPLPDSLKKTQVILTPVNELITLSSTQWAATLLLGKINVIKGVSEASYIQNELIRDRINKGLTTEVAVNGTYKPELIIQIHPDIILYSPDLSGIPDILSRSGSPLLAWPDYFENHPLGRAEWLKVMGVLLQKEMEADSIFNNISQSYNNLKDLTEKIKDRPTIFADKEFSGQWYVPGGESYMACLFKDAGADYLWADNNSTASISLGLETILSKALNADFWRIAQAANGSYSYSDLKNENEIYAAFKAFKQKKIIFCNTATTAYFEKSQFEPHIVLSDFIFLMHKELLPDYQPVYYYLLQ
jgi:iron complex transport system substrate-binding protein